MERSGAQNHMPPKIACTSARLLAAAAHLADVLQREGLGWLPVILLEWVLNGDYGVLGAELLVHLQHLSSAVGNGKVCSKYDTTLIILCKEWSNPENVMLEATQVPAIKVAYKG